MILLRPFLECWDHSCSCVAMPCSLEACPRGPQSRSELHALPPLLTPTCTQPWHSHPHPCPYTLPLGHRDSAIFVEEAQDKTDEAAAARVSVGVTLTGWLLPNSSPTPKTFSRTFYHVQRPASKGTMRTQVSTWQTFLSSHFTGFFKLYRAMMAVCPFLSKVQCRVTRTGSIE